MGRVGCSFFFNNMPCTNAQGVLAVQLAKVVLLSELTLGMRACVAVLRIDRPV